jgi:hypothetical protein
MPMRAIECEQEEDGARPRNGLSSPDSYSAEKGFTLIFESAEKTMLFLTLPSKDRKKEQPKPQPTNNQENEFEDSESEVSYLSDYE